MVIRSKFDVPSLPRRDAERDRLQFEIRNPKSQYK